MESHTCDIEKKKEKKKRAAHFITRAAKGLARVIRELMNNPDNLSTVKDLLKCLCVVSRLRNVDITKLT